MFIHRLKHISILFKILFSTKNWWDYLMDMYGLKKEEWILKYKDIKIFIRPNSVDRWIATENLILDEYRLNELKDLEVDTVIDLGANIGSATLAFANTFKGADLHSFEPNPDNFKQLDKNVELNLLSDRVVLYNAALSNKKSPTITLHDNFDFGVNSLIDMKTEGKDYYKLFKVPYTGKKYKVNNLNFDFLLEIIEGKTILKMDIEGGEYNFFKSHNLDVIKAIDIIELEYHNMAKDKQGDMIEEFLKENGFNKYTRTPTFFYIFIRGKNILNI